MVFKRKLSKSSASIKGAQIRIPATSNGKDKEDVMSEANYIFFTRLNFGKAEILRGCKLLLNSLMLVKQN